MIVHSDERLFRCDECPKTYKTKSELKKHTFSHTKKQYDCKVCSKKFSTLALLTAHMVVHTIDKRKATFDSTCSSMTPWTSSAVTNVQRNSNRAKTTEKAFGCNECGYKCWSSATLATHIRTQKPFECKECLRKFIAAGNLRQHMLVHTGSRPHSCTECHTKFKTRSHLGRHNKNLHKIRVPRVKLVRMRDSDIFS